ncbi:MAG: hypothetical protein K5785_04930 [Nitrosarchaeum sp.]|nr:hypothetical protein [Nitrosarchaeum sp.]
MAVTYGYSYEDGEYQNEDLVQAQNKDLWKIILTEKIVNGRLQVNHYAFPENATSKDVQRILAFEDESKWVNTNYKVYQAGIVLFDGKSSKIDTNVWKISNEVAKLTLNELELDDQQDKSGLISNEVVSIEEFDYKVIFSGKMTETNVDMNSVISLMDSSLKNLEMEQNKAVHQNNDSLLVLENSVTMVNSEYGFD